MKRIILLATCATVFLTTGCNLENIIKKIKHKYDEIRGKDERGPKPFKVIFQNENDPKKIFISPICSANKNVNYVYYETPSEVNVNYYRDTKSLISTPGGNLKPFWDIRYVNYVEKYINGGNHTEFANHAIYTGLDARNGSKNVEIGTDKAQVNSEGSVVQSKCVNGEIAGGTIINLTDSPIQQIAYAGPQSTFKYALSSNTLSSPWKSDKTGNIMIQAHFDRPIYHNFENNIGGGIYFVLFLHNKRNGKFLNYVIGVYGVGDAWMKEKAGIKFDPTTSIIHVATVIKDSSWWCTKSPLSKEITEVFNETYKTTNDDGKWPEFFRVNISYNNLLAVLDELRKNPPPEANGEDFGLNPEDWEVTSIMIQYELEEEGGKAMFAGSFKGFGAYITKLPI